MHINMKRHTCLGQQMQLGDMYCLDHNFTSKYMYSFQEGGRHFKKSVIITLFSDLENIKFSDSPSSAR